MGINANHHVLKDKRVISFFYHQNRGTVSSLGVTELPPAEEVIRLYAEKQLATNYKHYSVDQLNTNKDNTQIADRMLQFFNLNCPNETEYNWLDENDNRLCFYCWRVVFLCANNKKFDEDSRIWGMFDAPSFTQYLSGSTVNNQIHYPTLNNHPRTSMEARKSVIYYIDSLKTDKSIKSRLIDSLAKESVKIVKEKPLTLWFDRNDIEAHVTWIESYLRVNLNANSILFSKKNVTHEIQSFFDTMMTCNQMEYRYYISTMKKAWAQKKFRDRNTNKKQFCINMSNDIHSILEELASMSGNKKNKNELIESLIRKEYELMKAKYKN